MCLNIKELVIKYSLIFFGIFSILFIGSTQLILMNDMTINFGLLHFVVLFSITILIFFSFLFFKLLKFNLSLLKLMQLQTEIDKIKQQLENRQKQDENFLEKLNDLNNKKN